MTSIRSVPILVAALACAFTAARPVRADEAPATQASPLARLNAEEQRAVREKFAGFDTLPPEKQEQITRNVEWLRTADPAVREMVKRRVQQAHDARLTGQKVDQRVRDYRDLVGARQGQAFHKGLLLGGLGRVAWLGLPEAIRADPHAKSVEQPFAVAFHRRFWGRASRALDTETVLTFVAPATLPPELQERLAALRAQHARSDKSALGRLKETVLFARASEATRDLMVAAPVSAAPGSPRDPAEWSRRLLAFGERVRDLARPAYDETLKEFTTDWGQLGPRAWGEAVAKAAQPPELPPEFRRKVEALQAAIVLEALGSFVARHPTLAGPADALLRKALVDELGMSPDEFARLPARGEGPVQEQRAQALKQWIERSDLPREVIRQGLQQVLQKRWPGAGGGFPGRGKQPGPREKPDKQPEKQPEPGPRRPG